MGCADIGNGDRQGVVGAVLHGDGVDPVHGASAYPIWCREETASMRSLWQK
jgi:hypothetical protein